MFVIMCFFSTMWAPGSQNQVSDKHLYLPSHPTAKSAQSALKLSRSLSAIFKHGFL